MWKKPKGILILISWYADANANLRIFLYLLLKVRGIPEMTSGHISDVQIISEKVIGLCRIFFFFWLGIPKVVSDSFTTVSVEVTLAVGRNIPQLSKCSVPALHALLVLSKSMRAVSDDVHFFLEHRNLTSSCSAVSVAEETYLSPAKTVDVFRKTILYVSQDPLMEFESQEKRCWV